MLVSQDNQGKLPAAVASMVCSLAARVAAVVPAALVVLVEAALVAFRLPSSTRVQRQPMATIPTW